MRNNTRSPCQAIPSDSFGARSKRGRMKKRISFLLRSYTSSSDSSASMSRETGRPYREEDFSDRPPERVERDHYDPGHYDPGHHDPGHHDPGHHELEEAAFDLFRRILFPELHEDHPGEHRTEHLAEVMRLLDHLGHSGDFNDVLKEVEFYHPGFLEKLRHEGAHDYVDGLYRRHTEESFNPGDWEFDHGHGQGHEHSDRGNDHDEDKRGQVEKEASHEVKASQKETDRGPRKEREDHHEDQHWSHWTEDHSWDHGMDDKFWAHRMEEHPWGHEMEGHPWADHRWWPEVEGRPWVHEMEAHHWDRRMEDHPWDAHRWDDYHWDHPWEYREYDHRWDHGMKDDHYPDHGKEDHGWDHGWDHGVHEDHHSDHGKEDHHSDHGMDDHRWDDHRWDHGVKDDHYSDHGKEDHRWDHGMEDHRWEQGKDDYHWAHEEHQKDHGGKHLCLPTRQHLHTILRAIMT